MCFLQVNSYISRTLQTPVAQIFDFGANPHTLPFHTSHQGHGQIWGGISVSFVLFGELRYLCVIRGRLRGTRTKQSQHCHTAVVAVARLGWVSSQFHLPLLYSLATEME